MKLQEILYGTFEPPKTIKTIKHLVGLDNGKPYIENIDKRKQQINGMNPAQNAMYERLKKQVRKVSAADMGKKMRITTNHAGILLGELFKLGKVDRSKQTGNGTRFYVYEVKSDS